METLRTDTRMALVEAAAAEFEKVGYEQTNTNAIARRAGFAPQTFYRHFKDKLAIFLSAYARWTEEELTVISDAASTEDLVRATLRHHETSKLFRRTLRDLSVRVPEVAAARAQSRRRQLRADRPPPLGSVTVRSMVNALKYSTPCTHCRESG